MPDTTRGPGRPRKAPSASMEGRTALGLTPALEVRLQERAASAGATISAAMRAALAAGLAALAAGAAVPVVPRSPVGPQHGLRLAPGQAAALRALARRLHCRESHAMRVALTVGCDALESSGVSVLLE